MDNLVEVKISDQQLAAAAHDGMDAFIAAVVGAISDAAGGQLNAESLGRLNGEQITLWGYSILRDELMDGGFVQLIHNGYGPFFFDNPFAKAMRLWGLKDLSKLIYKAKELYEPAKTVLTRDCDEDEFMALFEQFPQFDDLDDQFVEDEELFTSEIAHYVDNHLDGFVKVID